MANNHWQVGTFNPYQPMIEHSPNQILDMLGSIADELQTLRAGNSLDGIEGRLDRIELAVEGLISITMAKHLK